MPQSAHFALFPASLMLFWLGGMFVWAGWRIRRQQVRPAGGEPYACSATRHLTIGGSVCAAAFVLLFLSLFT